MTNEESIFAEALTKESAAARAAYLDDACAGDDALRYGVEALLLAHNRPRGVLESPPMDCAATAEIPLHNHHVGSSVGPYKLLEQIGAGGMGVVYMAEQLRPIRRKVALKIIKPGMDSGQVIARFEAERQALAIMDHANIAKVFDSGTTDAGRPYFVMELVKGIPITDYCDQARLSTRQRSRAIRWSPTASATELGGGPDSMKSLRAERINAGGTVVGSVDVGPNSNTQQFRPARWTPSGTTATVLEHPFVYSTSSYSVGSTFVHDLNDAGTAVGVVWVSPLRDNWVVDLGTRAARWDPSGTALTELGHLGTSAEGSTAEGYTQAYARAINAAGAAVGNAQKYDAAGTYLGYRAVRWEPSGVAAIELGRLGTHANAPWTAPDGFTQSQAFAINSAGTAVGSSDVYDDAGNLLRSSAPVRWDASGSPSELGSLSGDNAYATVNWSAAALNDAGTAVGWGRKSRDDGTTLGTRALRWDASGTAATELGHIGAFASGYTESEAWAVNGFGTAVGWAGKPIDPRLPLEAHAVYWGADAVAIDLNTLVDPSSGWRLERALEISDTGWIVGTGLFDPDGAGGQAAYSRHFLMHVPASVPEPGALGLLGLALPPLLRRRAR